MKKLGMLFLFVGSALVADVPKMGLLRAENILSK